MLAREPSRTALGAAAHRAAHQLDGAHLFADPLAIGIVGEDNARESHAAAANAGMRIFIAARSRFAEDTLAESLARGVTQLVLLGAGVIAGSALMLLQLLAQHGWRWPWPACVAALVLVEAGFVAFMIACTRGRAWTDLQRCALMSGGLLVYGWSGFVIDRDLHGAADLPGHAVIAGLFALLLGWAWVVAARPAKRP